MIYTTRSLSHEGDRLVALSGLAQRFATIMATKWGQKEQYLAGLWSASLPADLLWFVELKKFSVVKGRRHERPTAWRAPSWSWASMEAPVNRRFHGDLKSSAAILEASTEPLGHDPFGQVKSGYLKIQAPLLHDVVFDRNANGAWTSRFDHVRYKEYELRIEYLQIDDDRDAETDSWLTGGSQTFSLLVVGYTKGGDLHEVLVLVPTQNGLTTFERVGVARLGPHLREPREHAEVIGHAPVQDIILI